MKTVGFCLTGTDLGQSGIGAWVREVLPRLARQLRAQNTQLRVFATVRDQQAYVDSLGDIAVSTLPSYCDNAALGALDSLAVQSIRAALGGVAVLVAPAANRRISWSRWVPTVAVVHDLASATQPTRHGRLRSVYVKHAVTSALRRADSIVAVSHSTARDVALLLGATSPSVTVVHNGVNASRFRPRDASDPLVQDAKASLGLHGPYVLYPSRLEAPAKNHHRLIAAFAGSAVTNTHQLVLVGKDWGAARSLQDQVSALGLGSRVIFGSHVSHACLEGLIAGASLVTVMGTAEGFGLPAIEAFASGVRVLAADAGALPEIVKPVGRVVDPFSVDAIRSAIERTLLDEEYERRIRLDGPRYASLFDWNTVAQTLTALCRLAMERADSQTLAAKGLIRALQRNP